MSNAHVIRPVFAITPIEAREIVATARKKRQFVTLTSVKLDGTARKFTAMNAPKEALAEIKRNEEKGNFRHNATLKPDQLRLWDYHAKGFRIADVGRIQAVRYGGADYMVIAE